MNSRFLRKIVPPLAFAAFLFLRAGYAAVAPVAQLPTVTVGAIPSLHILPLLMVSDRNEWRDFGIQMNLKVYRDGEEQAERVVGNEWDVGILDPFYAIKAGNDGDIAIVGLGGNAASQFYLLARKGNALFGGGQDVRALAGKEILCPAPSAEHLYLSRFLGKSVASLRPEPLMSQSDPGRAFLKGKGDLAILRSPAALEAIQKGMVPRPEFRMAEPFLPACLVASASYADTRKTLVIRWLEGYSRGVRIIQKDPSRAASRLKAFYEETLKVDVPQRLLEMEVAEGFFDEKAQEEAFRSTAGNPSAVERFASWMSDYQVRMKVLTGKKDPGEYILGKVCGQLAALRGEAEAQFKRTRTAIEQTEKEGTKVEGFRRQLLGAREQMEEGRGCLTVIGTLANLMRGAEQARVEAQRFKKFRLLEIAIGGILVAYYGGYAFRRRRGRK
jgi:ABC-type nitrate/sulfonate/bicarbonate transport system substrate-binding protein